MIQRIQSIYYLLAAVITIVLYVQPFVLFSADAGVFGVYACHLVGPADHNVQLNLLPLTISLSLAALISFVAIFMYKNRRRQMLIGRLSLWLFIISIGLQGAFYMLMYNLLNVHGKPGFAAIIPVLSILLVILANRGVKKDDDLIKSADRIR